MKTLLKNSRHMFKTLFSVFILTLIFQPLVAQEAAKNDSIFEKISIDDLIKIKEYYDNRVDRLVSEKERSLLEGKKLGESFLSDEAVKIENRDKIYIRIAEYYIEEAERDFSQAMERYEDKFDEYERQFELYQKGELAEEPTLPETPSTDYSKAISIYDRLLDEYPASEHADAALYSKAWLKDKTGAGPESRRLFQEVIDKYPDSPFAPESYIQLAEYYFRPREDKTDEDQTVLELRKAIQLYKKVLRYRDSRRYDEALYKLGWSYYKLASRDPAYYTDAITYFMAVADDIELARKLDPQGEISNPNVRDEAIEYIGISFTDESYTQNGVDKARRMLERLGDKEYGVEIMRAIGQTYEQIDENTKAIYAFRNLLDMYPYYREAPVIQDKISKAVFAAGDDQGAYRERAVLFEKYNPKSDWYARLEQSNIENKFQYLDLAYRKSEEALRANLYMDLERAETAEAANQPATQLWTGFGEECRTYLEVFPSDSNAYDIHWSYAIMLDQKLGRFEEAFEEYLTVSNDYLMKEHQHQAALYAVGVADTIVKIKYGSDDDSVTFSLADIAQLSPEALTPEETNLIQAYDNYIRLFPDGQYTPNFLASAGSIYYNHKKFAEAKVYFQTLVRRFPGAEEKSLAMRSIMDSYFALGKFKDSEIIAKRILSDENLPPEQREFASRRLAEAIFKNAEFLAEQGDFLASANEYLRLYEEVPENKQYVEPALWNAGLNFQKARDWVRSNEVFNILASEYPESEFSFDALNMMVENYKELEQFDNAARISERVYLKYPDSEDAEAKLYNASYFFQKASEWQEAIRVNNVYIANYPQENYAVDLFFKNADLYLKMDNLEEANRIYEEFAQRYPEDDRVVTAFYERGNYYLKNGLKEQAKQEYNKAISKSEEFRSEGKEYNPYIAGEAVHKLADILHEEYVAIELKQPQSNIERNTARMRSLLDELNQAYTRVLAFGSPRSFEATYNIARSYEEFADTYAGQEIDPSLDANKRFARQKEINEQSAALYENAVNQYKEVINRIPTIADKLGVDMSAPADSVVKEPALQTLAADTTLAEAEREVEPDSTRQMAFKFYEKAKDKVSELLYAEASLTSENVYSAINIQAPSSDPLNQILYKSLVYQQVVTPAVSNSIEAHLRNINEADEMGLSNKYVAESKRQILLTSNILAEEYKELAVSALDEYDRLIEEYKRLVELEFGTTNDKGLDYYGVATSAAQMLDENYALSNNALNAYANTLTLAQENGIENDLVRSTEDKMLRFGVETAERMQKYSKQANDLSALYATKFDTTENYNYDDARVEMETFYYTLGDNRLFLLENAFALKQKFEIKGAWANALLLKLLEMDPVRYSESIDKERVEVFSDQSWLYSLRDFASEWIETGFDDSGWQNADIVFSAINQFEPYDVSPDAIWTKSVTQPEATDTLGGADTLSPTGQSLADTSFAGLNDTIPGDTLLANAPVDTIGATQPGQILTTDAAATGFAADTLVFFRKNITFEGKVVGGNIYLTADDDFRMYINGEYIVDDQANDFMVVDTVDFYTIDRFLKQGKNIIAIDVMDRDLTGSGLKFYGYFEVIPSDITAAAEQELAEQRVTIQPQQLRRINILSKNRIPLNKQAGSNENEE